jgi:hypothetical protein
MAMPSWPIADSILLQDGFGLQRMLDPISTHARAAAAWR